MSFSRTEIEDIVKEVVCSDKLLEGVDVGTLADWVSFVCEVDLEPKSKHPLLFYASVAVWMAESLGSCHASDYADPHMRDCIIKTLQPGAIIEILADMTEIGRGEERRGEWLCRGRAAQGGHVRDERDQ